MRFRTLLVSVLLLGLSLAPLQAQTTTVPHDSVAVSGAFIRAHGDTLFLSMLMQDGSMERRSAPQVIVFHGDSAEFIVAAQRFRLSPSFARVYRDFLAQAMRCPKPQTGCELGHEFTREQ